MGTCPECAKGLHERHSGKYPVDIKSHGKKIKSRSADCECPQCTRPQRVQMEREVWEVTPSGPPAGSITYQDPQRVSDGKWTNITLTRDGTFTYIICQDCHHGSHWRARLGSTTKMESPSWKGSFLCMGCPVCRERKLRFLDLSPLLVERQPAEISIPGGR